MKNLGKFFSLLALVGVAACNNAPKADVESIEAQDVTEEDKVTTETYTVSPDANLVHWVGFKTYASTEHKGTITVKEGSFKVEGGELKGGEFVIDMTSITNEDLPEEGKFNKERLLNHLKSDDFFHAEKYPTAKFTITKVKEAPADHKKGATHMVSGNLEMRGNTRNITIPAIVAIQDDVVTFTTPEFVIDRTQWEVEALSTSIEGVAKDNLVDNSIKLKVDLQANKS